MNVLICVLGIFLELVIFCVITCLYEPPFFTVNYLAGNFLENVDVSR